MQSFDQSPKQIPHLQDQSKEIPHLQGKSKQIPHLQDKSKQILHLQDKSKQILHLQDKSKQIPHLQDQLEVEISPLRHIMDVVAVHPDPRLVARVAEIVGHRSSELDYI